MFSSILQMMGFPAAKPLHSRATEKNAARADRSSAAAGAASIVAAPSSKRQEQPPRRSTVKSSTTSTKKVSAKPVKKPVAAKPVATKKSVKPQPKAKAAPARAAVKPAVKSPAKSVVKPTAKSTVKPKAKPAVAKKAVAAAGKKPASVKTKAAPQISKPVAAARSAKPVARPAVAQPKKKSESVTRVVETKPVLPKSSKADKSAPPAAKPVVKPVAVVQPATASSDAFAVPVRSGRPSSRLAQLTVPSIAQSVASNAAKSTFTQVATPTPITSPAAAHIKKNPKLANNWKSKAAADLTDEEVIAMPDQEYMNDTQMAFFRQKLVNLKNAILNNAGETTEHLREDTVVVPDPADRATIEEEHALELRTRDRERKLLKKIEQSINRIDAGDYGYCDETGEPIGVARLLARPTATLSLEAQQRRELKQKMFGD